MFLFLRTHNLKTVNRSIKIFPVIINAKTICTPAKVYSMLLNEEDFIKQDNQRDGYKITGVTAIPAMPPNGYHLSDLYQQPGFKYMLALSV